MRFLAIGAQRERAVAEPGVAARPRHREDIQGLRAVAVLLVALGHAGVGFLGGGYIGVDVFFVVSGFLITGILLGGAAREGWRSARTFYARRARRILPAAALTLVATDIAGYYLLNFVRAKQLVVDSVWASLFAANIHFARQGTDYFAQALPPSAVQHYWTLAVEEQFYLAWPAVLLTVILGVRLGRSRRRGRTAEIGNAQLHRLLAVVILISVGSFAWCVHRTRTVPTASYFGTSSRIWELALGAMLAIGSAHVRRVPAVVRALAGWTGLAAILAAGVTFSATTAFPGYAALLPTLGTVLVLAAGLGQQDAARFGVARLLGMRPLSYIGDRSYSFYLWHWPVLILAAEYKAAQLSLQFNLVLLAAAFALSIVSYRLFENPLRRMKWPTLRGALLLPVPIAATLLVAVVTLHAVNRQAQAFDASPSPVASVSSGAMSIADSEAILPAVRASAIATQGAAKVPRGLTPPVSTLLEDHYTFPTGCAANDGDITSAICRLGDASARKTIVVFGDSHAQMWMPAIVSFARSDHWAVIPLVKSGCLPSRWVATDADPKAECRSWYRWAVQKARAIRPDLTLVTGSSNYPTIAEDPVLRGAEVGGFRYFMAAMKPFSKAIVVIGDPPSLPQDPVDCLLTHGATMAHCSTTMTQAQWSQYSEIARLARHNGGFLDTLGWFCFRNRCPTVVGNTITRADPGHVTQTYALKVARPFAVELRGALRYARRRS